MRNSQKLYASGGLDNVLKQSLNTAKSDAKSFYYPGFSIISRNRPVGPWLTWAYNLGGAGLKKFAKLKRRWTKPSNRKNKRTFEAAAKESKRNGIQSSRNAAIYDWIAEGY